MVIARVRLGAYSGPLQTETPFLILHTTLASLQNNKALRPDSIAANFSRTTLARACGSA
jgi:hypothetical protein